MSEVTQEIYRAKDEEPAKNREGRNIVLCFDGTGDWAATDTTNVMKIYERADKTNQLVYYNGGVGTLTNPSALNPGSRLFLKLLDLAVATSLRNHVLDGYKFLIRNYQQNDRIYIFGFSRGAFTARLLAALIHNFGLLKSECEDLSPYVWQTISDFDTIEDFWESAKKIKDDFARPGTVKVRFLGLFDTVSSVGVFERFKVYPNTDWNPSVEIVRHAVSIDEQRNGFPELLIVPDLDAERKPLNDVAEIWFPGVHRDIGGGASDHPGYANQTLNWMVDQANKSGLVLDTKVEPVDDCQVHLFTFDPYVFIGLYPMKIFDYLLKMPNSPSWPYSEWVKWRHKGKEVEDSGFRWYWPNFKHIRQRPANCFTYLGNGEVEHGHDSLPIERVRCVERPKHAPIYFSLSNLKPVVPDLIGIVLGVALAVLVANRSMGGPISGDPEGSWPWRSSAAAFLLFAAFLVQQGFSQWLGSKPNLKRINTWTPVIGAVLAVALAVLTWTKESWWMLIPALGAGFVAAGISVLGKRPILRADRVVPLFMVPWFFIIVGLWVIPPVISFASPFLDKLGEWLFRWQPGLGNSRWEFYVAWFLAALTAISGVLQIVQDRRKMQV